MGDQEPDLDAASAFLASLQRSVPKKALKKSERKITEQERVKEQARQAQIACPQPDRRKPSQKQCGVFRLLST